MVARKDLSPHSAANTSAKVDRTSLAVSSVPGQEKVQHQAGLSAVYSPHHAKWRHSISV